ncbi:hypothetical protein GCM10009780_81000 [Actinomadura alba]
MAKGKSGSGKARSAITGRYVKKATAQRHPRTTVVEQQSKRKKKWLKSIECGAPQAPPS